MKRALLCLLWTVALPCAVAAAPVQLTEITVPGSGTVSASPDIATVGAAVETTAPTAASALDQNNRAYDRIVAALVALGIARSDVAMLYYNVNYNPPRPEQPGGFTVSRSFSVKVRSVGKAGTVTDACLEAGATAINGVSFDLADKSAATNKAIEDAVASARRSAQTLAAASALHIVRIKSIELSSGSYAAPMGLATVAAKSTAFDQSPVTVQASVTVVFLAQP